MRVSGRRGRISARVRFAFWPRAPPQYLPGKQTNTNKQSVEFLVLRKQRIKSRKDGSRSEEDQRQTADFTGYIGEIKASAQPRDVTLITKKSAKTRKQQTRDRDASDARADKSTAVTSLITH